MSSNNWIDKMARVGLSAKGVVYSLIGLLVLWAVIQGNESSVKDADKGGVFDFIQHLPAGKILLAIVILGLFCYTIWRFIQAFRRDQKAAKRVRYIISGLVYGALSVYGTKLLLGAASSKSGSGNDEAARKVLSFDGGAWLLGLAALILAGVGVYQIYYGLSEKYKKHVSEHSLSADANKVMLSSGKIGYIARGVVWFILSFLLGKAAVHSNASEAGATGDAFQFVGQSSYGPILLAALAAGLLCYGIFNFIRARYESFT